MYGANETMYSITLHNDSLQSTDTWSFCVFQKIPDGSSPDILKLAWLAQPCACGNKVTFRWPIKYTFEWSQTGELKDGAVFIASGSRNCDPHNTSNNSTELVSIGKTCKFVDYNISPDEGQLLIHCGDNIDGSVAIGIGMGSGTVFATQATSNSSHLFIPHPEYYVTLGMYEQGTVIDHQVSVDPLFVDFKNYQSVDVTLDAHFKWTLKYTNEINENCLEMSKQKRQFELKALREAGIK